MTAARLRLGSLCSGYGGLDLAVTDVLDVDLAWVADCDPAAATVLAHHHPGLPNLGDIRDTDWAAVPPVDVLTAGWPCQPVSMAGRREGLADERWLFDAITHAIGRLEPRARLLVLENVPGLLSAGDGNAMAHVVQSLAGLGYMGSWRTLSASSIGAPHRRRRLFLVAAHTPSLRGHRRGTTRHRRTEPAHHGAAGYTGNRHRWGRYAAAIARWERLTGRAAPAAVEPARDGHRLAAAFVEWLMGLPDGHVTGVAGLTRTQQLTVLGNGVVPQQGAAALRLLLDATGWWPRPGGSEGRS